MRTRIQLGAGDPATRHTVEPQGPCSRAIDALVNLAGRDTGETRVHLIPRRAVQPVDWLAELQQVARATAIEGRQCVDSADLAAHQGWIDHRAVKPCHFNIFDELSEGEAQLVIESTDPLVLPVAAGAVEE